MKEPVTIGCPRDIAEVIKYYACRSVEHFGLICLDGSNHVIGKTALFKGGYTRTFIDPRVCLYYAIKHRAVSVVVWHNHPSGNEKPSEQDIVVTEQLKKAFEVCGMDLIDHVILSRTCYYSLLENAQI